MRAWWSHRSPQAKFFFVVVALVVVYTIATSGSRAASPASTASSSPSATVTAATVTAAPAATDVAAATGTTAPVTATPTAAASIAPPTTVAPESTATSAPATTSTCQLRGPLPDPVCTPGATDARVTQANIHSTICVSGYTTTVRPPTSYTNPLEVQLIAKYGLNLTPQQTELDHLIALELGGNPTDVRNLFPEPYEPRPGAHEKDALENRLHTMVCAGQIDLAAAQNAIATDWVAAYHRYVGP